MPNHLTASSIPADCPLQQPKSANDMHLVYLLICFKRQFSRILALRDTREICLPFYQLMLHMLRLRPEASLRFNAEAIKLTHKVIQFLVAFTTRLLFLHLQVSKDKLSLQYTGPGDHETDVGCIQANHTVPRNKRVYYYEVHIVNGGMKGLISIGFAEKGFNLGKHPGYDLLFLSEHNQLHIVDPVHASESRSFPAKLLLYACENSSPQLYLFLYVHLIAAFSEAPKAQPPLQS